MWSYLCPPLVVVDWSPLHGGLQATAWLPPVSQQQLVNMSSLQPPSAHHLLSSSPYLFLTWPWNKKCLKRPHFFFLLLELAPHSLTHPPPPFLFHNFSALGVTAYLKEAQLSKPARGVSWSQSNVKKVWSLIVSFFSLTYNYIVFDKWWRSCRCANHLATPHPILFIDYWNVINHAET